MRLLLVVAACAQGIGDRCQADSDCVAGAVCQLKTEIDCPNAIPGCNACLEGGSCRAATPERDQPCQSDLDCGAGRSCVASGSCARLGQRFCVENFDMSVIDGAAAD